MLVSQPRARQNHGRESGVGEVDGDAAWNQLGRAGLEFDRPADAGAQIQAGGAAGGILRQTVLEARVQYLDVESVHV